MVDYHVDRPEVEAPQGVELTGTNRSEILLTFARRGTGSSSLYSFARFPLAIGSSSGSPLRRGSSLGPKRRASFGGPNKFLALMAAGLHPFPSRTRQLSPPAPMIVGPQGPSKVGRCQISEKKRLAAKAAGFFFRGGRRRS